jgi:hypothetical protein
MKNTITSKEPIAYRAETITSRHHDQREGNSDIIKSKEYDTLGEARNTYNHMLIGMEVDKRLVAVFSMDLGEHTEIIETTY